MSDFETGKNKSEEEQKDDEEGVSVLWDGDPSSLVDIVVCTTDRRGLIHTLASSLMDLGLDIQDVAATTQGERAFDHFKAYFSDARSASYFTASDLEKDLEVRLSQNALLDMGQMGVTLIKLISSHPHSKVWEGRWVQTRVAVKILTDEDPTMVRQECEVWSKIHHPHVCNLFTTCVYGRDVGVVMEYFDTTLEETIHHSQKSLLLFNEFPFPSRYRVLLQLAQAIHHLHSLHVLHRDIKPSNILLDEKKNCKLSDFGLSVLHYHKQSKTGETGTYKYMAPEVIRHETYAFPCDVYSFAITAFETLTRTRPFSTMTPIQAAFAVADRGERPPLPDFGGGVGTKEKQFLKGVIEECWKQSPDERPTMRSVTKWLHVGVKHSRRWLHVGERGGSSFQNMRKASSLTDLSGGF